MIPRLAQAKAVDGLYRRYLDDLAAGAFAGEISIDYASRLVAATDNSVYQVVPEAVLFPRSIDDVVEIGRLASRERYRGVTFTPRGAGTGTNGGSLGRGLSVDMSRHMNDILDLDLEGGTVRVQPGVILDQLNSYLRPHGVFFAPHVATSDRATLGGMISNDSCGVGSRVYGRTSRHVESLTVVLADGARWQSRCLSAADLDGAASLPSRVVAGARAVLDAVERASERIEQRFPQLDRFLTGYDLAHATNDGGEVDLNAILCGSEGTLAFVVEAVLRLSPIPAFSALVVASYTSFDDALVAAQSILDFEPSAIETIDATILELAREDLVWPSVAARIGGDERAGRPLGGLNLIELSDGDRARLERRVADLCRGAGSSAALHCESVPDDEVAAFWALRKKGAGLLGNMQGARRPVAFVEDCAVAPARLAEFVAEFRAILDGHGLRYGIYGHVDVGCLHVRPALDLCQREDRQLLRAISDQVFALVESYGGVMWGEHGKGFRSEYSPQMLGPELYRQMRRIKEAFDPFDQLNPGKVATPASTAATLSPVDSPMRGEFDGQIDPAVRRKFAGAVACNGNGACFSWDVDRPMCPSMKATGDRVHSPKGRAAVMREWLRQLANAGGDDVAIPSRVPGGRWLRRWFSGEDFSHEVFDAFAGCLACKACVAECPIHVDIPGFKAEFLRHYHQRYPRSLNDRAVASLETALPALSRLAEPLSRVTRSAAARWLARRCGVAALPRLAPRTAEQHIRRLGAEVLQWDARRAGARTVLLLDAFTNFFEPEIPVAMYQAMQGMGEPPSVLAYRPSGKSLHVSGMLDAFDPMARRNAAALARWADRGCDIVCVEPAVALLFRQEYRGVEGAEPVEVLLPQEWLVKRAVAARFGRDEEGDDEPPYVLLGHCTESTTAAAANELWMEVFNAAGLVLVMPPVGCCGMAGAFGYKTAHLRESQQIFEMSWGKRLASVDHRRVLATGHSCRTQVERFAGFVPRHPLQVLRDRIGCASAGAGRRME